MVTYTGCVSKDITHSQSTEPLSNRGMCYSIQKITVKSRISDRLDILKPLLHIPQLPFSSVSQLQNYSAHVPSVVNPSVANAMKIRVRNISVKKQWKQMYMRSVAFIMRCVWSFPIFTLYIEPRPADILWYYPLSREGSLGSYACRPEWSTSMPARKPKNGRRYMESSSEVLGTDPFWSSADGKNSVPVDCISVRPVSRATVPGAKVPSSYTHIYWISNSVYV